MARASVCHSDGGPGTNIEPECILAQVLAIGLSTPLGAVLAMSPGAKADLDPAEQAWSEARPVALSRGPAIGLRRLSWAGIPVRGAFETVSDGKVVASVRPDRGPQRRPEQARIAREHAEVLASGPAGAAPLRSELVYLMVLGRPILAWEVELPLALDPEPSRRTVWVSASTGRILDEREHVFSIARARVFDPNPVVGAEPVEVELRGLLAPGPASTLTGERVASFDCSAVWPDPVPEDAPPWWEQGDRCYPSQVVRADAHGDFLLALPDVRRIEDNLDADDPYAALSMYYHAEKFLAAMAERGISTFSCEQATLLANYRRIDPSSSYPDLEFGPVNNAYYTGDCGDDGPTMLFGQGSSIDFAFDGDVVYHELGHGIVDALTPEGLGGYRLAPEATLKDARALNEAIADYLSAIVGGDARLGEYVARYWPAYSQGWIRSADGGAVCPADIEGEEHADGEPVAAALWAARLSIGAVVDELVALSLPRLARDTTLTEFAAVIRIVADELGALTEPEHQLLDRAFAARGLIDCPRTIDGPGEEAGARTLLLRGRTESVTPFFPGPMQLRHEIPEGSDNVVLTYAIGPSDGRGTAEATLLLKREDRPIAFRYDLTALDGDDGVEEVVAVRGDWDQEHRATVIAGSERMMVVRGLAPGEVVWTMLVTPDADEARVTGLRVVSVSSDQLDQGTHEDPEPDQGEGEGTGGGEGGSLERDPADAASCACTAGSGGLVGGLPLSSWFAFRRRRRR